MTYDDLPRLATFALLGPGFGSGKILALTELRPPAPEDTCAFALLTFEERAEGELDWFTGDVHTLPPPPRDGRGLSTSSLESSGYEDSIRAIREAIARGEVYQANFTRFANLGAVSGSDVFRALTRDGLAPYGCWLRLPSGLEVVGASPECLFRIEGTRIVSEPMKGTAKLEGERELLASPKEDAELSMITDLVRHELATCSREKSVRVLDERRLVRLPYALQTIARVAAELPADYRLETVLRAMHPAGSVVGAPKRTALDLLKRLESTPRGPYCGTLVFREGMQAVAAVLIRTAFRGSIGEPFRYGTGSGITWQSEAKRELAELELKVSALR